MLLVFVKVAHDVCLADDLHDLILAIEEGNPVVHG
jgi:hypothetical protein